LEDAEDYPGLRSTAVTADYDAQSAVERKLVLWPMKLALQVASLWTSTIAV
jgi:hypothetical protein